MKPRLNRIISALLLAGVATTAGMSAQAIELKDAVERTLIKNPEVRFRLHAFRSAVEEVGVGRAGYGPTVDVTWAQGHENNSLPVSLGGNNSFTRHGWSVNLLQNLFDGFQTTNTYRQLSHAQRARYLEFVDFSENQALETSRAYLDVLRYRALLDIAKENYATHKGIFDQIQQKVSAGVGRRVDLEQAAGRLALAESNMLTEQSNLHDVSARYARLVGSEPPAQMVPPDDGLGKLVPADADVITRAIGNSPAYLATLENLQAARYQLNARRGAFSPTVDIRARQDQGDGIAGAPGQTTKKMIELVVNFNLSRGGADKARLGMAAEGVNTALDLRDKACVDLRQTVRIAFNDTRKLKEQMGYLRQHALSTEKARDAYRKQFDIGQRTLLDVLDSENELLDSRRAVTNAEADLKLAGLRVLAGSGRLLESLQLKPSETFEYDRSGLGEDDAASCDTTFVPPPSVDKAAIPVKTYVAIQEEAQTAPAAPQVVPAPAPKPVPVPKKAKAAAPVVPAKP